jgi:putative SOS response-associated peptidase YedK
MERAEYTGIPPVSELNVQAHLSRNLLKQEPFAFAGLWDNWRAPQGATLETCTILTTTPNQLLADIHDRMPVILPCASYDLWLDPGFRDLAATTEMLKPYDAGGAATLCYAYATKQCRERRP